MYDWIIAPLGHMRVAFQDLAGDLSRVRTTVPARTPLRVDFSSRRVAS
jgi:hypothetical protein